MKKLLFIAMAAGTLLTLGASHFEKRPVTPAVYAYDLGNDTTPKKHKHKKDTTRRDTAGIAFQLVPDYISNK